MRVERPKSRRVCHMILCYFLDIFLYNFCYTTRRIQLIYNVLASQLQPGRRIDKTLLSLFKVDDRPDRVQVLNASQ